MSRFIGDVLSTEKKIGDLNGKWAVMLKLVVLAATVLSPLILSWTVWVTSNIYSTKHHMIDTEDFRARIVEIEKAATITPSQINDIKKDADELKTDVKTVRKENAEEHQGILVELGKIQVQLESMQK